MDSSPSSKPPSSDIAKTKPKKKPGRPKKPRRGGQPGHEQHLRQPLAEDRVNEILDYEINEADVQRLELTADRLRVRNIPAGSFIPPSFLSLREPPSSAFAPESCRFAFSANFP